MASARTGNVALFRAALELFDAPCRGSGLKAFGTLARSLRTWRGEIFNYAVTGGASNGFTEALNHLVENQKRQAHGDRSWLGFRGQILWCFGEAVDPDTGELGALRSVPRGAGARFVQPSFASSRETSARLPGPTPTPSSAVR
jgi:hypothetical protein